MKSATFVLVGELCPSGYVLQGGSSQSVCLCNEDIPEILLCKDDQQTIVIEVGHKIMLHTLYYGLYYMELSSCDACQ